MNVIGISELEMLLKFTKSLKSINIFTGKEKESEEVTSPP